ncbi:hypothetical protein [Nocardia tengchongensis]|uniref:hypothetical protein n=1 Tax=Nocardia tengchongensis TaxID=2055889 RepID=UPI0036BED3BD
MTHMTGDSPIPDSVRHAVKALFGALGVPVRDETWAARDESARWGCHPIFGLAEHYKGHDNGDAGYTANPYRGDHMSIPSYTENGDVFVLDISFHKGDTHIERIDFPEGPADIRDALYGLLVSCETR